MKYLFLLLPLTVCCEAQTIAINPASRLQTIDGFGAAVAQYNFLGQPNSVIDAMWSTTSGVGLSLLRTEICPDLADCNAYYGSANVVQVASGATLNTTELAGIQRAYADGAIIWASLWSPPASMMSNCNGGPGVYGSPGCFNGNSTNYAALAALEASYVTLMTGTYGIPIYAISVQNEPDVETGLSCYWDPSLIHAFVPYLKAALAAAGYPNVKIMMPETGQWGDGVTWGAPTMNDATTAADVDIVAAHGYAPSSASQMSLASFSNVTNQHLWETEVSNFNTFDPSIADALNWAVEIHQWLTVAGVNAWNFWYGPYCPSCSNDNQGLMQASATFTPAKRMYMMGNWARFVKPGWSMVGVSNSTGLLVTAFTGPSSIAVVVVNNSGSAATSQAFSGVPGAQVTPWITSATYSLQAQTPVSISGNTFSYTIPANSIVTLVSNYGASLLNGGVTLSGGVQVR